MTNTKPLKIMLVIFILTIAFIWLQTIKFEEWKTYSWNVRESMRNNWEHAFFYEICFDKEECYLTESYVSSMRDSWRFRTIYWSYWKDMRYNEDVITKTWEAVINKTYYDIVIFLDEWTFVQINENWEVIHDWKMN